MRTQILALNSLLALLFLAGCQIWNPGGAPYSAGDSEFTIHVPSDWMYSTKMGNDFTATKDGQILQSISVEHHELKDPLPHSKRTLTTTMVPYEAAEAVLNDLRANHDLLTLEVKENQPVTVGGRPGFKLTFSYRTADKLRITEERYGCIVGDRLYFVRYSAPSRYYFERDLGTFEETVKSLQFGKPPATPPTS